MRSFAHEVRVNNWSFCDAGTIEAAKKDLVGVENFKFEKAQLQIIQDEFRRKTGGTPGEITTSKYFEKITCIN
jgi:hypothetical protein